MLTTAPMLMDELAHSMSKASIRSSPTPLWLFTPRTHIIRSDVFSRFVLFDGRVEVSGVLSSVEAWFSSNACSRTSNLTLTSQQLLRETSTSTPSSPLAGLNTARNDIYKAQDTPSHQISQRLKLVSTLLFNCFSHTAVLLVLAWKSESIVSCLRLHAQHFWQVNTTYSYFVSSVWLCMYAVRIWRNCQGIDRERRWYWSFTKFQVGCIKSATPELFGGFWHYY